TRFTLEAYIQPTRVPVRPAPRPQVIMGTWAEDARAGFALLLDETGALAFLIGAGGARDKPARVTIGAPLTARRWDHVTASGDLVAGTATLGQTPLADHTSSLERPATLTAAIHAAPPPAGAFFLGAPRRAVEDGRLRTIWHFNGKIDRPGVSSDGEVLGLWDLSADIA